MLVRGIAEGDLRNSAYVAFQKTYRDDPVAFTHDCTRWRDHERPALYQDEILAQLPISKRVAVRSPHGAGKTALAAWAALWYALTRDGDDWKIPTTASVWRQLERFLWPEIRWWTRALDWQRIGRPPFDSKTELLNLILRLETGEAFAVASDVPDAIEGAHATSMFYVFDEAKSIPANIFDAAEGAFAGGGADTGYEALALVISTPGEPTGRFYDIQSRKAGYEDWVGTPCYSGGGSRRRTGEPGVGRATGEAVRYWFCRLQEPGEGRLCQQ